MRAKSSGIILLALVLCALPFLPGLRGPFLLDDHANLQSARVVTGSTQEWLDVAIRNDSGLLKRPISNLSFAAERRLLGEDSFHFKATNLAIHLLVALALWRLALQVLPLLYPSLCSDARARIAALAAVFWAVHPIQVSTVLYVVQRMAQLSALFVAIALAWLLGWLQRNPAAGRSAALRAAALAWLLVALGLLCKENAILFPCYVLAVFLACDEQRGTFTGTPGARWAFAACAWLPLAAALAALPWIIAWAQQGYAVRNFSMLDRLLTEPLVLWHYLGTMLVPDIRNMGLYLDDIPIRHAGEAAGWIGLLGLVAVAAGAIALRRRAPALCFAVLWFLAGQSLESSFLPLEPAFEHRNYLPLFGPALAAAYYLCQLVARPRLLYLRSALFLLPVVLAGLTAIRSAQWSTPERFIVHEAENHPRSPRAQTDAAAFDSARGDNASALRRIVIAQQLRPDDFWYRVMDVQVACDMPGHHIDWAAALASLRRNPQQIGADEALMQVAGRFLQRTCANVPPARYEQFLHEALAVVTAAGLPERRERFMVLISWMRAARGDQAGASRWLHRAVDANPSGTLALQRLAYDSLNAGRLEDARNAIGRMQQRLAVHGGKGNYELRELQAALRDAEADALAKP